MPSAEYMRKYRQTLEGKAALMAQARRDKARRRAVAHLIARHRGEFEDMFLAALKRIEAEFEASN